MATERRLVFGELAELYDRARPSYPAQLVRDVIEFSGVRPGGRALEVGAGTGKATGLFAAAGLSILALEPSAAMARVARRNLAGFAEIAIEESDFESWHVSDGFALLYSAQAWHWVIPEVGYSHARLALVAEGALAIFWNRPRWERNPLRAEMADAYRRTVPEFGRDPGPMHPASPASGQWTGDWNWELASAAGFDSPRTLDYDWSINYSRDQYLELLHTHSDHAILDRERRAALLDAVGEVIDRHGGRLKIDYVTHLVMARAVAPPSSSGDRGQAPPSDH